MTKKMAFTLSLEKAILGLTKKKWHKNTCGESLFLVKLKNVGKWGSNANLANLAAVLLTSSINVHIIPMHS